MQSSTPPGHTKLAVPTIVLWGWLGAAVAALIGMLIWVLQMSFTIDHRIIASDAKSGDGLAEAKRAYDLAAHQESRIDALDNRIRQLEIQCATRRQ